MVERSFEKRGRKELKGRKANEGGRERVRISEMSPFTFLIHNQKDPMAKIVPTHQNKTYLSLTGSPVDYTGSPVTLQWVFFTYLSSTGIPVAPTSIPLNLQ